MMLLNDNNNNIAIATDDGNVTMTCTDVTPVRVSQTRKSEDSLTDGTF